MIAILVIIGIVGAISLYDFLNTRNWQQVTSKVRNDAVFENRNREYGAYKIRKDYNRNFMLILLAMTGGIGVIYGAASTFRGPIEKAKTEETPLWDTTIVIIEKDEVTIPEIKLATTAAEPPATTQFVEYQASDTSPEIKPNVVDSSTIVGLKPQTGKDPFGIPGIPLPPGPGNTGGGGEEEKKYTIADLDEIARYVGGTEACNLFLRKNLHFPEVPLEEGRGGKSYVKFVVAKNGNVEEVALAKKNGNCPECDKEAIRVVNLMPKWIPGKRKGKDVDSYFNLPLTFEVKN